MSDLTLARLGEVLELERDEVVLQPEEKYRLAGIFSFGKGIFEREPIRGADTSYSSLFRLHTDDFILSRLNGWEGAVDVVSPEFDGCLVSSEYPTFAVDVSRADPRFLRWIARWPRFWDQLVPRGSMVRRKRVQTAQLLDVEIPLPSIEEQRRTVAVLDQASGRAKTIAEQLEYSRSTVTDPLDSWLSNAIDGFESHQELGEVATVVRGRGPRYEPDTGFFAINQGCVRWGEIDLTRAREVAEDWWSDVTDAGRVHTNDVLINSTGEGTIGRTALAPRSVAGTPFDSHVLVVRCDEHVLLPGFLAVFLRSEHGQAQVKQAKGANTTKQTELGKTKLQRFRVPTPSLDAQAMLVDRFRDADHRTRSIKSRMNEQHRRLAAYVPSLLNSAFGGLN